MATEDVPLPPSSEGSGRRSQASQNHVEVAAPDEGSGGEDGFDSDEFRAWMRNRSQNRRNRRRQDDSEDDGRDDQRSSSGPPPEWDGEQIPFLDYQIKANLWLATTKAKPRTRGPLLLQKLSKTPFEAMKHLARDTNWMQSDRNGEELLDQRTSGTTRTRTSCHRWQRSHTTSEEEEMKGIGPFSANGTKP